MVESFRILGIFDNKKLRIQQKLIKFQKRTIISQIAKMSLHLRMLESLALLTFLLLPKNFSNGFLISVNISSEVYLESSRV